MLQIYSPYLDKHGFIRTVKHAVDDILFKAGDTEILGETLYDQLYSYVIQQMNQNIDKIVSCFEDPNNSTMIRIRQLEEQLHEIKQTTELVEKNLFAHIQMLHEENELLKKILEKNNIKLNEE